QTEEWAAVVEANLSGHLRMLWHAIPAIRRSPAGRIVNVSTALVERGAPGATGLIAAKAGLHGATRALAWELGNDGILVNVVMPGLVLDGHDQEVPIPEAVRDQARREVPIGRLPLAHEVANAIVFLCSSANGSITGEVLRVTSGRA